MPFDAASFDVPAFSPKLERELDALHLTLASLKQRGSWIKGAYSATYSDGRPPKRCLVGWLQAHSAGSQERACEIGHFHLLPFLPGHSYVQSWNDRSRTRKKDVIELVERAIAQFPYATGNAHGRE